MPYEITNNFTIQSYFCQHLYYLRPGFWTYYASFLDHFPFISSFAEQGTNTSENPIQKNTPSKRISLFYPRILPTTFKESYRLEIPSISNNLYHF